MDIYEYILLSILIIASGLALFLRFATSKASRISQVPWKIKLAFVLLILILPLLPYIQSELLTRTLGKSIIPAISEAMHSKDKYVRHITGSKLVYYKVLGIHPSGLNVYYVTYKSRTKQSYERAERAKRLGLPIPDRDWGYSGFMIVLKKSRGKWRFAPEEDYAFWTDMGNAHAEPFPPYPAGGSFR